MDMRGHRFVLAAVPLLFVLGCGSKTPEKLMDYASATPLKALKIETLSKGSGQKAEVGDTVYVKYVGKLKNGFKFDDNVDKPLYPVNLGGGGVIQGWQDGFLGSMTGEKRRLHIPAALAYGAEDKPPIPPNSDLYFDIEIARMVKRGDMETITQKTISEGTGPLIKLGNTVSIHYNIKGTDGKVVEDSRIDGPKTPKTWVVGDKKAVIPGINAGIIGLQKGGRYIITLPPRYGIQKPEESLQQGNPVDFEIEVIDVK